MIQARQLYPQDSVVQKIIEEHLPQLARKNYQAIAKDLGIPLEEVGRAARLIGELDPKPGRYYNDETIPYITPDVFVYKIGDEYVVVLNEDGLPKLRINPYYRDILREQPQAARGRQGIHQRQDPVGALADQIHPSASADRVPGHEIHRQISAGVSGQRGGVSETHGAQGCGAGCGNARIDHQPGHLQQICSYPAGDLRAQVLLQQQHQHLAGGKRRFRERERNCPCGYFLSRSRKRTFSPREVLMLLLKKYLSSSMNVFVGGNPADGRLHFHIHRHVPKNHGFQIGHPFV